MFKKIVVGSLIILGVLTFVYYLRGKGYLQDGSFKLEEESQEVYPTNLNEIKKESDYYYKELGLVIPVPEGFKCNKESNLVLSNKKEAFVILGDTHQYYDTPGEVFDALKGTKENLDFILSDKKYNTDLYDFTGGLTTVDTDKGEALLEYAQILTHSESFECFFLNFPLSGRAVSVGLISQETPDVKNLLEFSNAIKEVSYTGVKNPYDLSFNRKVSIEDTLFKLPATFLKNEEENSLVFSPVVTSGDILYGSRIILTKTSSSKGIYDPLNVYKDKKSLITKTLGGGSDYIIRESVENSERRNGLEIYSERITLIPNGEDALRCELSFEVIHIVKDQEIHLILSGIKGRSAEIFKVNIGKIIEESKSD